MGEVFEALDRDRDGVIAIKTLSRADGKAFARFKREFRALQSTSHPNLVSLGELVCVGDLWLFTMELVDGKHFLENARGDRERLRASLGQLVSGLSALHQAGLVHRDVKPSNVMVTREGRVVILDFGLVTTVDPARQSIADGPIGTIEYMAPEQASGRQVDEAADWYSVGVMLYEALTGQMPHKGHALEILLQKQQVEPQPAHELASDAPRDLCDLCMELLAIEPSARPSGSAIARKLGVDAPGARRSSTSVPAQVFVGRERERAALDASAAVARERPRIHLVIGESGIGKSELVARFVRSLSAEDPGALILAGRCYERESVPFKAFDGVADGLAQVLGGMPTADVKNLLPDRPELLVRLFPVFQRVEAISTAPIGGRDIGEPHEQRRRMFIALRELLAALARTCRVVITIDDLQWADADSYLLLRELFRGADAPPMLVIATVRGEPNALEAELEALPVERTRLGPLTGEECRELAERLLPGAAGRFDIERVSREAGGHPMFFHEILRHLDVAGAAGEAGATLDDALSARVALLRPNARSVLEVVCIAGAPISLEVAAQACRLDATAITRAVASLRVATLVRETQRGRLIALEPYHDRVRESVEGRIAKEARRDLHARIAYALEAAGEPRDPQLLLRNFRLAEIADRAARYAEEAAQRSEAAHAFDQAAELWKTALDAIPRESRDRSRVLLRLGRALVSAGRGAEAAKYYLAAAEGVDRATRLECHRSAAEQLVISGHIAPGIAALGSLLAEIGVASPKTTNGMLASLLWHRAQVRVRGLGFRERHRREISDATRLELEVLKVAAYSLSMIDVLRGMDFQTRHLLMALQVGDREHVARALLLQAIHHATASDHKRANQYIERAIEVTEDPNDPLVRAMVPGVRSACTYFAGDIVKAVDFAEESIAKFRDAPGNSWEASSVQLFQMFALRYVGDHVTIRAKYELYKQDASERGDRYLESTLRRLCVSTFLAENDARGAVRELVRATWVPPAGRFHVQHFHELIAWCEIGLYRGVLDERAQVADRCARLERSMILRVESIRLQYSYLRGRLALAGHLPEEEAMRAARKLHKEKQNPLAVVWALVIEAGTHTTLDPEHAATLYAKAAEAADRVTMRATAAASRWRVADLRGDWAARGKAEAELAALGVRDPRRMCRLITTPKKTGVEVDEVSQVVSG
jgi:eukaryotic-like serine/threonine-protein kinase